MKHKDTANETDVREELAAPFLARLGYARGTPNEILREVPLRYGRHFLGRKKNNDPPLRGRADYVLSVAGAGRWVLDTKSPADEIGVDAIEQVISYARHPEISGTYAAILNGRRFVLFHCSQRSDEEPRVDIAVEDADQLAAQLEGVLSPSAVRRDVSPPIVDINTPLADGYRSSARVIGGFIQYTETSWSVNALLPKAALDQMDEALRRFNGYRANIIGGEVKRDEHSRIVGKLTWAIPHDEILNFVLDKHLMDAEYVSLSERISTDPASPTVFDVVGRLSVVAGKSVFDMMRWESKIMEMDAALTYRGQALGHLSETVFHGKFQTEYETSFPLVPWLTITIFMDGEFEVNVDPR